jgi:hypothetical protein
MEIRCTIMKRRTLLKSAGAGALAVAGSGTAAAMTTDVGDGDAASAPSDCSDYTECEPCLDDPNCEWLHCDACH